MRKCFEGLLWKHINRLYRKPNALIRNRFLREYRNASEESRNKRNAETYYVLKAFAKHNDAEAIRGIYSVGYPGRRDADEVWTETSLAGIAVENRSYEALQVMADCGVEVGWYGGVAERLNWAFVIANKDVRMCQILATAKNRLITDEAASFILEHCHDMVEELVKRTNKSDQIIWHRVLVATGETEILKTLHLVSAEKEISLDDRIGTLIDVLRFEEAEELIVQNAKTINAEKLWCHIFPECMSDSYTHDYFYSDEVNLARNKLITTLLNNNLLPNEEIVKNLFRSVYWWWPQNENSYKNYLRAVTDLLALGIHPYDKAIQEAMWWTHDIELVKRIVINSPVSLRTDGLAHMLVDASLTGYWPEVISRPLGRIIRFDLWRGFCKEHNSYISNVIDVLRCAHERDVLRINELDVKNGETALHTLCREAFPQALWMPCIQELITTLVEVGADLSIKDNCNKTAYDYATGQRAPKSILRMLYPD